MGGSLPAAAPSGEGRRGLRAGYLGRVDYADALALQHRLRDRVLGGGEEHLLLLEHPPVFTLGRNADRGDLRASAAWLEERDVQVVDCDRGGRITLHGPGQLVGYPILDLSPDRRDVRRFVRDLQEVLVRTLADFGVAAVGGLPDRPAGVCVGERKIASIGVHLRKWVTTHGFALNVSTDLELFAGIVPCGLPDVVMTSVQRETGRDFDLEDVARSTVDHFAAIFARQSLPLADLDGAPRRGLGRDGE